ncbi:MAG: phosphotransferase [Clostridiales bacterium]|nr:phosphotransferase [Clostridiales bacterium]
MEKIIERAKELYGLTGTDLKRIRSHEGGRNTVFAGGGYVLRVSCLSDRTMNDYLAETEFIRYLAENGAPVADVICSISGNTVERVDSDGTTFYLCLFEYAKGMLIADNGYRYREGVPLEEYFYNTGKALGAIHRLSKSYCPRAKRRDQSELFNEQYIDTLIPDSYRDLKDAIGKRLQRFADLPKEIGDYGLVHFDFSDGNYHVDLSSGDITVFDFDNCLYCWYMFDLAHLWTHGTGWYQFESDPEARKKGMDHYFATVLEGYRSETDVSEEMLDNLQLFIDMTIIEYVIDEFQCSIREGELPDPEDIEHAYNVLIHDIPFAGFF